MSHTTIDRQDCINLFHQLMRGDPYRILRLLGESKLGKSHLLTKVFPVLAQQDYQAHCAVFDLRNSAQTAIDILDVACSHLGGHAAFPKYYTTYQEWNNPSQVQVKGLQAFFSSVHITLTPETNESMMIRQLTSRFIADLRNLTGSTVLLLFDTVEGANESTRNWLMDTLLVQLSALTHVRTVVAGCSVPEACSSYTAICCNHELKTVKRKEEYIAYCREVGVDLVEQSVQALARAFDYKPGLFAETMPKFLPREVIYGQ